MAVNEKFPVPVSGQPIPKGWFARLVRFINSLVLSGDEQYVMVKRTDGGTTITLTPSFVNDLKNAAAPAAGGGGAVGFPDYNATRVSLDPSHPRTLSVNSWLIGEAGATDDTATQVNLVLTLNGTTQLISLFSGVGTAVVPVCIPIPAGSSLSVYYVTSSGTSELYLYPCITS